MRVGRSLELWKALRSVYDKTLLERLSKSPDESRDVQQSNGVSEKGALSTVEGAKGIESGVREQNLDQIAARAKRYIQELDLSEPAIVVSRNSLMHTDIRERMIADWGDHLQLRYEAGQIRNTKELPHPKELILRAICEAILTEADEQQVEILIGGAGPLADYQEGVGDQSLSALGADPGALEEMSVDEAVTIISNNPTRELYEHFEPLVRRDYGRILSAAYRARDQRNN